MSHSKRPADLDRDGWTVTVEGAVTDRQSVSLADLRTEAAATVETPTDCDGADAARRWTGVRVGTLLDRAGVEDAASHALVHSVDPDFACGFELDRARDAVLAVRVGGDPIPAGDGGPVRLLPAGDDVDCWERVKRVVRVAVLDGPPGEADTAKDCVPA